MSPSKIELLAGRQCHPVVAHMFVHQYMKNQILSREYGLGVLVYDTSTLSTFYSEF